MAGRQSPVIKALTEGVAGNAIDRGMGVMERHLQLHPGADGQPGLSYADAFAEADGWATWKPIPSWDVGGIDRGRKS